MDVQDRLDALKLQSLKGFIILENLKDLASSLKNEGISEDVCVKYCTDEILKHLKQQARLENR